jgi:hypothetical protein
LPVDAQCSITADAWFSNLPMLERYSNIRLLSDYRPIPITFGLSQTDLGNLDDLFTFDLCPHECRMFTNDIILVQFWEDNKTVRTGSNAFYVTDRPAEGTRLGPDCLSLPPVLPLKAVPVLQALDISDLKSLARWGGVSVSKLTELIFSFCLCATGGSKEELAYRIAGRLPPALRVSEQASSTPEGILVTVLLT